MYVTLEPCNHFGRTPPCTEAIIAAGVARVVVGVHDPDPRVAGSGIERLRAAGVRVDVGTCSDIVSEQLAPYLHHRRTGRPFVVLKLAMTIDGYIAAKSGSGGWITGETARRRVHEMRAESDAIVVVPAPCAPTTRNSPCATPTGLRRGASCLVARRSMRACSRAPSGTALCPNCSMNSGVTECCS